MPFAFSSVSVNFFSGCSALIVSYIPDLPNERVDCWLNYCYRRNPFRITFTSMTSEARRAAAAAEMPLSGELSFHYRRCNIVQLSRKALKLLFMPKQKLPSEIFCSLSLNSEKKRNLFIVDLPIRWIFHRWIRFFDLHWGNVVQLLFTANLRSYFSLEYTFYHSCYKYFSIFSKKLMLVLEGGNIKVRF